MTVSWQFNGEDEGMYQAAGEQGCHTKTSTSKSEREEISIGCLPLTLTESHWKSQANGDEHCHAKQLRNLEDEAAEKVDRANIAQDDVILDLHQQVAEEVHKVEETWNNKLTQE